MGFFDIFKGKKSKPEGVAQPKPYDVPYDVKFSQMPDGKLQVDFYARKSGFQFYDTTRLIVDKKPINIAGRQVQNCAVSWYGSSDCGRFNEQTGEFESPRAGQYRGVYAQIDLELLKTDFNYCNIVMQGLMDKKRVEGYLETGLQERPERPCGKYIGGIGHTEEGYEKIFDAEVGKASHYSALMVKRRQERRNEIEQQRLREIEDKEAQIKKLQEEISGMDRDNTDMYL